MMKDGIDPTSVEGAANIAYEIPNIAVDLSTTKVGVPVLWWRVVGCSHTTFAVEAFIDEVAHEAGQDPFELRRKLLDDEPRMKPVLELAAREGRLERRSPAERQRPRDRGGGSLQDLRRPGRRGERRRPRRGEGRSRRVRRGLRHAHQSRRHRGANGRRHRIRSGRGAVRRHHAQGRAAWSRTTSTTTACCG